jgi:hypothetical protein
MAEAVSEASPVACALVFPETVDWAVCQVEEQEQELALDLASLVSLESSASLAIMVLWLVFVVPWKSNLHP